MRTPAYPPVEDSANAFFQEAIRHLNDAHVLFQNGRFPATITSAHKAQELAVKAALILNNAIGFWDKLFKTHKPLIDIESISPATHPLKSLNHELDKIQPGLPSLAQGLEKLEPQGVSENTEYPYHDGSTGSFRWRSPATEFDLNSGRDFYNLAWDMVDAVQSLYPLLVPGNEPIPPRLS